MPEEKKLNNLDSGSEEGITKDKTEGDEKDKGEELIGGVFKSQDELVKAYKELQARDTRQSQDFSQTKERLAKLEGMMENQKKEPIPQITPEEKKQMVGRFKDDFNVNPLDALHSFVTPYVQDARAAREEVESLRQEVQEKEKRQRSAIELVEKARKEDPEGFDELKPLIEKELRENETWAKFKNPYTAAFYHVKGKSIKTLPRTTDAERESHVEGSSAAPPSDKTTKAGRYKKYIISKSRRSTVL